MNKLIALMLVAASGPAIAAQADKVVTFEGSAQPVAKLSGTKATVYGADGKPLFRGDQAFILAYARNREAKVYEWNPETGRVRVSAAGAPPAWLPCSQLEPMANACTPPPSVAASAAADPGSNSAAESASGGSSLAKPAASKSPTRGFSLAKPTRKSAAPSRAPARSSAPARAGTARGLPNCPGDPRCPKM